MSAAEARMVQLATAAQADVDELAASGTRAGTAAMRPFLRRVLKAIADAEDEVSLRQALVEVLRSSDGERFAEPLTRARVMAHLTGMLAVQTETEE